MTTYRTDWRNIGAWINVRFHPSIGLRTPWGNIIVKRWADRLFSERHGERKSHFWLLGLCVSWVRLRHYANLSEAILDISPQSTPLVAALSKARSQPIPEGSRTHVWSAPAAEARVSGSILWAARSPTSPNIWCSSWVAATKQARQTMPKSKCSTTSSEP